MEAFKAKLNQYNVEELQDLLEGTKEMAQAQPGAFLPYLHMLMEEINGR